MSHFESIANETKHHELLATDELHEGEHVHVSPFWPMTLVFAALLILTIITVLTAHYLYLGNKWNLIIALVIACTKATLVFAYFMHLRYDKLMNTVVVASCLFAVILFLGITLLDTGNRNIPNVPDSQFIVPGGVSHYTKNDQGGRDRSDPTQKIGIVKKAIDDGIAAHGNPESGAGEGHGDAGHAPASGDHAAPAQPAQPSHDAPASKPADHKPTQGP